MGQPSGYTYNPYGKNPYRQNPYGKNPSAENPWGKQGAGWNPIVGSYQKHMMSFNPQLPLLETLELPDVSKLMNDLILHNPYWPPVLTKIPSDCPKYDGKSGEDP